jgi:hypothetical protein
MAGYPEEEQLPLAERDVKNLRERPAAVSLAIR